MKFEKIIMIIIILGFLLIQALLVTTSASFEQDFIDGLVFDPAVDTCPSEWKMSKSRCRDLLLREYSIRNFGGGKFGED